MQRGAPPLFRLERWAEELTKTRPAANHFCCFDVCRMQLADRPEIVVATPSRALAHLRSEVSPVTPPLLPRVKY